MIRYKDVTTGIDGKVVVSYLDVQSFEEALGIITGALLAHADYGSTIKVVQPVTGSVLAQFTFRMGKKTIIKEIQFDSYPD